MKLQGLVSFNIGKGLTLLKLLDPGKIEYDSIGVNEYITSVRVQVSGREFNPDHI